MTAPSRLTSASIWNVPVANRSMNGATSSRFVTQSAGQQGSHHIRAKGGPIAGNCRQSVGTRLPALPDATQTGCCPRQRTAWHRGSAFPIHHRSCQTAASRSHARPHLYGSGCPPWHKKEGSDAVVALQIRQTRPRAAIRAPLRRSRVSVSSMHHNTRRSTRKSSCGCE